ncbi:hypothetical protein BZG36_02475 [Bifiguratus adelaidae]|uniref:C3H1-type domain-containing protein n=1 Tax=Bifiguratus adelaidae TaxID=1938954 RepID=A0A261Y114_9FUNG|nr:hypothetical protein BZG36_02475 [Bifiguratus adelaidae]
MDKRLVAGVVAVVGLGAAVYVLRSSRSEDNKDRPNTSVHKVETSTQPSEAETQQDTNTQLSTEDDRTVGTRTPDINHAELPHTNQEAPTDVGSAPAEAIEGPTTTVIESGDQQKEAQSPVAQVVEDVKIEPAVDIVNEDQEALEAECVTSETVLEEQPMPSQTTELEVSEDPIAGSDLLDDKSNIVEPDVTREEEQLLAPSNATNGQTHAQDVDISTSSCIVAEAGENHELSEQEKNEVAKDPSDIAAIREGAAQSDLNWKAAEFVPSFITEPLKNGSTATASSDDDTTFVQQPTSHTTKKIRCRFWPRCTNKNCKFVHPKHPCRNDGHCQFGDKCIYYHSTDPVPSNDGVIRPRRKGSRQHLNQDRHVKTHDAVFES